MKHAKRLLAVLAVAVAMALTLGTAALADEPTSGHAPGKGTITINNAVPSATYKAYRIFELESFDTTATPGAYAYKVDSDWSGFFAAAEGETQAAPGLTYVTIDDQGYVTWKQNADAAAFAAAAIAWAKDSSHNITADGTQTCGENANSVTFSDMDWGYYLIDTNLGSLCILETTNPNIVVAEKNEQPNAQKEVQEDSDNKWYDHNDGDITQVVNFKSTLTGVKGAQNLVFHDKMSAGLTFDSSSVKVYKNEIKDANLVETSNYTLVSSGLTDQCTFEVRFNQTFIDSLAANDKLIITYSATLNENAVIGDQGNPNEVKVSYGDEPGTTSVPDTTKTYTWPLDIFKYTGENTPLNGALFVLKNSEGKVAKWTEIKNDSNELQYYRFAGWEDAPTDGKYLGENNAVIEGYGDNVLISGVDGKIHLKGLDSGTYTLSEILPPAGYNKLAGDVTVTMTVTYDATTGNPTFTTKVGDQTVTEVKVQNQTGSELPSTGGIGTTIFYVVGGILVVGAAVLLITKKRVGSKK